MNTVTRRAYVLLVLILAFFFGSGVLIYSFVTNESKWAVSRANAHLYSNGELIAAGKILDRDGVILAQTIGGKRQFHQNRDIRVATLHAVGDNYGYIATGAHTVCRDKMTGYSKINGYYDLIRRGGGKDVRLTIDAGLCVTAYQALGGRKGCVGVYNYKTGQIVCMTSSSSYDPLFRPNDINTNPIYEGVYLNRLLNGMFTPGSIFKVITAARALDNIPDITTSSFNCSGQYYIEGSSVKCQSIYGHGTIPFSTAFAQSCNSTFAQIGVKLGNAKLIETAKKAGFTKSFNISGVQTAVSKFTLSTRDDKVSLGWTSVGQGETLANPLHMMMIAGAIANSGSTVTPYFIYENSVKTAVNEAKPNVFFSQSTALGLQKLMRNAVLTNYGDGKFPNMEFCGKTGTAEVEGETSHAWFIGYSLRKDFPYAIVVCVQNGGAGSAVAVPVASAVMQKLATRSYK